MIDRFKIILENVEGDKQLFKKELIKSKTWLEPMEWEELSDWVNSNFKGSHDDCISEL
ncbi:hypothetical protein OAO55_02145 [Bacteroidales bacterium]|nr:hypothetical protein [Bacteroidales bacterium]